jgi:ribosomal protein S18 acetylase RimI-like enzyme
VTVRIVAPEVGDADTVADLWVALASEQRPHGSTLAADANREVIRTDALRRIVADEVLIARDVGGTPEIVGFVTFERIDGRFAESVDRGLVNNLYVRPEWRNDGIGTRLLAAAEERLAEAGATVVGLEAMTANDDARQFYRRAGYDPHRIEFRKRIETDRSGDDPSDD